jgi:hypothetical protein
MLKAFSPEHGPFPAEADSSMALARKARRRFGARRKCPSGKARSRLAPQRRRIDPSKFDCKVANERQPAILVNYCIVVLNEQSKLIHSPNPNPFQPVAIRR